MKLRIIQQLIRLDLIVGPSLIMNRALKQTVLCEELLGCSLCVIYRPALLILLGIATPIAIEQIRLNRRIESNSGLGP